MIRCRPSGCGQVDNRCALRLGRSCRLPHTRCYGWTTSTAAGAEDGCGGWGRRGQERSTVVVDGEAAVQALLDLDPRPGVALPLPIRLNLEAVLAQADGGCRWPLSARICRSRRHPGPGR